MYRKSKIGNGIFLYLKSKTEQRLQSTHTWVEIVCGGGDVPISLETFLTLALGFISRGGDGPQPVDTFWEFFDFAFRMTSPAVACIFSSNAAHISSTESTDFLAFL